jgi:hypothetical protein
VGWRCGREMVIGRGKRIEGITGQARREGSKRSTVERRKNEQGKNKEERDKRDEMRKRRETE